MRVGGGGEEEDRVAPGRPFIRVRETAMETKCPRGDEYPETKSSRRGPNRNRNMGEGKKKRSEVEVRGNKKVAWLLAREPVRLETYWHTSALLDPPSLP